MVDTDFHVPADKHERFAANYQAGPGGKLELIDDPGKSRYLAPRKVNSGGGGLVSTAADYLRFCRFMLNKGELDGTRLFGRKTVELMTMNHLKGDMADMGMPRFSESTYYGVGFGLGFSVMRWRSSRAAHTATRWSRTGFRSSARRIRSARLPFDVRSSRIPRRSGRSTSSFSRSKPTQTRTLCRR